MSTFLPTSFSKIRNPITSFNTQDDGPMYNYDDCDLYELQGLTDYIAYQPEDGSNSSFDPSHPQTILSEEFSTTQHSLSSNNSQQTNTRNEMKCKNRIRKEMNEGLRVSFRVKTEIEIMDDGYRWRKYGKKKIKNTTNPRNYYKCSSPGCSVKKIAERDREDSSYVITTYQGIHNHQSPSCIMYYNPIQDSPFSS